MQFQTKLVFYLTFLSVFWIICAQNDCKVVINELNVVDPKRPAKNEFIELKATCGGKFPLRGFKLIGFNCQSRSGTIDLVVTLWNERTNENGYFTIGGSGVSNANFKFSHDMVKFRSGFNKGTSVITNFMTTTNKDLRAFGLLYGTNNAFQDFVLDKKQPFIKISDSIIDQLKKHLIDLVIYAPEKECECNKCDVFEIVHEEFLSKDYTLHEIVMNAEKSDISLNRCTVESEGFLPQKFKLGNPTPSSENDCTGPNFVLKDRILDIIGPVNEQTPYADDFDDIDGASCSNQCTTSIQRTDFELIGRENIGQAVTAANETSRRDICTNLMLNPDGANTAMIVGHENQRKRHISDEHDHSEELEWETTSHFQPRWIDQIKAHQIELIPVDVVEKNKVWVEYLYNAKEPKISTLRCRLCYKYFDEFRIKPQHKSSFASKEGMLRVNKFKNKEAITLHANSPSHLAIIEKLQARNAKR